MSHDEHTTDGWCDHIEQQRELHFFLSNNRRERIDELRICAERACCVEASRHAWIEFEPAFSRSASMTEFRIERHAAINIEDCAGDIARII